MNVVYNTSSNIKEQNIRKNFEKLGRLHGLAKIFGMVLYDLKRTNNRSEFKVDTLGTIVNIAYVIAVSTAAIALHLMNPSVYWNLMAKYVEAFDNTTSSTVAVISLLIGFTVRQEIPRLLNDLVRSDIELAQNGIRVDYARQERGTLVPILTMAMLMAVEMVTLIISTKESYRRMNLFWFSYYCVHYTYYIIRIIYITQFVHLTNIIYFRFNIINNYARDWPKQSRPSNMNDMYQSKISILDPVTESNCTKHTTEESTTTELSNYQRIRFLSELHDRLCDFAQRINGIFGPFLLITIGYTFATVAFQMYYVYDMLNYNRVTSFKPFMVWWDLLWAFTHMKFAVDICYYCSKTRKESQKSRILLCRISTRDNQSEIKFKIDMFNIQIMHQKIEFSACGLFPIDMAVPYMIIGAVSTYLIYLIQFEMAFHEINGCTNHTNGA